MIGSIKKFGDNKWHPYLYSLIRWGFWVIYIISFLGVAIIDPTYIYMVDNVAKLYVALLLMIKFNPFIKYTKMTKFDKQIAWNAGLFLFLSSTFFVAVKRYISSYIVST